MSAAVRMGIDVGGTFTDGVVLDGESRLRVAKVATTPGDLTQGFLGTLAALQREAGVGPDAIEYLAHGSTVATNAVVQGRTARVGLLTTAGFRDMLEIGTQRRAKLYDLGEPRKSPLVPRELRLETRERIGPEGQEWEELAADDVRRAAEAFREGGVEAVAVCFLFSFTNPAHEEEARRILAEQLPGVPVTISSEVAPEFREFLRTSTTVVNAALLPLVGRYVERLEQELTEAGVSAPLHLMQSNGGVTRPQAAARLPVGLIASGPAAGVIAAARLGKLADSADVLGFDMGGTTADVSLVVGGAPQMRFRGEAADHPVNLPEIDVLSVGAGGGSIARVDRFGTLTVGPESAGADPGPAAYGRGGDEATVTDAHVVLGTLDPAQFLGGRMGLDPEAARRTVEHHVGRPLSFGLEEAAAAILRIANATMVRALRVVSVARGHDPRRFALVALGGAGPMHACAIAGELGIRRVIVPRYPGVASALGLLLSDVRHDLRQTWVQATGSLRLSEFQDRLAALDRRARELLPEARSANGGQVTFELDMRYRGQAYELTVPLATSRFDDEALRAVERDFHAAHEQTYGYDSPIEEIEIVTLRAHATTPTPGPKWNTPARGGAGGARPRTHREIWTPGRGAEPYAVYERESLREGSSLDGPAIIEQDDSTIVVEPGWRLATGAAESAIIEEISG